ncbi:hypothetical protein [Methylobacterium nodulans]|uniref:Uncharacterized protein n=1 Tax=Methylobacterium nodulans (strain LMG 21967 / CNCM I-2342 / ORS 2060) TaxID=460265 RepID=B8ICR7_METNO|nr:hypothetical protein [Methylobacterium nodulans]ACL57478.1 hypothetical protein Mnod_2508 [Methylobacterium nodulans ORS 2060]
MRALPITITADDSGHFNLAIGNGENTQHATGLAWDELLGMVGVLTHPEIQSAPYGISKVRAVAAPERGEVAPDVVPCVPRREEPPAPDMAEIRLPAETAYQIAAGLADLLWWAKGFNAARPTDATTTDDRAPCLERLREVRSLLLGAANAARGVKDAEILF